MGCPITEPFGMPESTDRVLCPASQVKRCGAGWLTTPRSHHGSWKVAEAGDLFLSDLIAVDNRSRGHTMMEESRLKFWKSSSRLEGWCTTCYNLVKMYAISMEEKNDVHQKAIASARIREAILCVDLPQVAFIVMQSAEDQSRLQDAQSKTQNLIAFVLRYPSTVHARIHIDKEIDRTTPPLLNLARVFNDG